MNTSEHSQGSAAQRLERGAPRMSKPTITLFCGVYRGGEHWKECWASILQVADLFDTVSVSFNASESQAADHACVLATQPDNVRLLLQPSFLTGGQHLFKHLETVTTDYLFILCHDDLIHREGVRECLQLIHDPEFQDSTIFGSHYWFGDNEPRPRRTQEILELAPWVDRETFFLRDARKPLAMSISGIVMPVRLLRRRLKLLDYFRHGYRVDTFLVALPGIQRIYQTHAPTVSIRLHPGQHGKAGLLPDYLRDNLTYFFLHLGFARRPETLRHACRDARRLAQSDGYIFMLRHWFFLLRALANEEGAGNLHVLWNATPRMLFNWFFQCLKRHAVQVFAPARVRTKP